MATIAWDVGAISLLRMQIRGKSSAGKEFTLVNDVAEQRIDEEDAPQKADCTHILGLSLNKRGED